MYEPIILGIIQGLTEWLPISSQGQVMLVILNFFKSMSVEQALQYSIWLHLGTASAATYYFKEDILQMIKTIPKDIKRKNSVTVFLLIATLISGALGFFIYNFIKGFDSLNLNSLMALIGFFLIISGLLQLIAKNKSKIRNIKDLKPLDGIILGLVQSFSIIPGISRSGITTSFLLFRKFQNHAALKLSYLMSIPVVIGAEVGMGMTENVNIDINSLLIAVITSFVVGLLSLKFFMKIAQKVNFGIFCLVFGSLALIPLILSLIL